MAPDAGAAVIGRRPRPPRHVHEREVIASWQWSPWGLMPQTVALLRCPADGDLDTVTLNGRWSIGQLRGDREQATLAESEGAEQVLELDTRASS